MNITKQFMRVAIVGNMLLTSFFALADVVYTGKVLDNTPYFLPKRFVSDGKSELYSAEWDRLEHLDCKFTIYDGKFTELSSFSSPIYPSVAQFQPMPVNLFLFTPENQDSMSTTILTQTLFNNDNEFEWVVDKYVVLKEPAEENVVSCGFKVMSQNGSTIAEVDYPNYILYANYAVYVTSDGIYLLVQGISSEDDNVGYNFIYNIDPNSSSIQAVGAPRKVSVSPTAPRRGTPVNVSLGEPVGNNCKLSVVSASGRTAIVQNLKPGDSEAVIDTNRLGNGVYVVVVDNGKTKREATKIVVR